MSIENDSKISAESWFNLAKLDDNDENRIIDGKKYTTKECYEQSLSKNPKHYEAWCNLGILGGGNVRGKDYSTIDCHKKELFYSNPKMNDI